MRGELVQTISIPDDCVAIKVGQTIEIRKKVTPKAAKLHCRDCEYLIKGHATYNAWYETSVCKLKPKPFPMIVQRKKLDMSKPLYFSCSIYNKICEHFKLKEDEDKHKQV